MTSKSEQNPDTKPDPDPKPDTKPDPDPEPDTKPNLDQKPNTDKNSDSVLTSDSSTEFTPEAIPVSDENTDSNNSYVIPKTGENNTYIIMAYIIFLISLLCPIWVKCKR